MRRWISGFFVFPIALFISLSAFHIVTSQETHIEFFSFRVPTLKTLETPVNLVEFAPAIEQEVTVHSCEEECPEFTPEFVNLPNWQDIEYPDTSEKVIDNFELDFNSVKNGERMLVFVNHKGRFSLKNSRAKLKLRTTEYGEKFHDILFDIPGKPILAFKNFAPLRERIVVTAFAQNYHVDDNEKEGRLETGYSRSIRLFGSDYKLRVSNGQRRSGDRVGVLVLSVNGVDSVIHVGPYWPDSGPALGDLIWAGDIDGDKKLDLLVNHSSSEEGAGSSLFLSSQAERGQLVKLAAVFGGGGC